jgi:flagella basal body P-ring formation protein FlgA
MHAPRLFAALAVVAFAAAVAPAADPVVIDLPERATSRTAVVTVGTVAALSGGDPAARDRIARLDLAELRSRESSFYLSRRVVEIRLQLAGIDPSAVTLTGADRTAVSVTRRAVAADEVVAAARADLLRRLPSPEGMTVELALPIAVRLPEVPEADRPTITVQPHPRAVIGPGRVQMDVTISNNGERLLAFAAQMAVRPVGAAPATATVSQATAITPAGTGEVLVKARQRTKMVVRLGAVEVTAIGEAQQDGRLGQTITLQNVDSKKMVSGRVVGPGTVDVNVGGAP